MSPDRTELREDRIEVNLEEVTSMRTFGQITDLPYTINGVYEFEVAYKATQRWKVVARIPLEIVHEQPEPEEQESEPTE